jgi:hypothetical protein
MTNFKSASSNRKQEHQERQPNKQSEQSITDHDNAPKSGHLTAGQVLQLQHTIGNKAVQRLLTNRKQTAQPPLRISSTTKKAIQRAVGFEFEFGEWRTAHNDEGKSNLAKGEEIIKGSGYKIEGEDGAKGSAIEVVTKPYTTLDEAQISVGQAQTTLKAMFDAGQDVEHSAATWDGAENVLIKPHGEAGKMQASPAVTLDKLSKLYDKQAEVGGGKTKSLATKVKEQFDDGSLKANYLDDTDPSESLIGLVTLIVDYMEQGSGKGMLSYPKSAFKLMARTSFKKMLELVPEHAFFSKEGNIDKWVNLVLEVAAKVFGTVTEDVLTDTEFDVDEQYQVPKKFMGLFKTGKMKTKTRSVKKTFPIKTGTRQHVKSTEEMGAEPVLGQTFNDVHALTGDEPDEGEANPSYKLNITRDEWLRNMLTEDKLSKGNDRRFEGMGAYPDSTDVEVLEEDVEAATTKAVTEMGVDSLESSVEDGEGAKKPERKPKEAPIFEFRGMKDMFGISQDITLNDWGNKVEEVFKIVDDANEGSFAPGGKPNIPPDVDNPAIWEKQ